MEPFVLYCKSYKVDVKRVVRLADTIKKYNVDNIPFFVSVPKVDLQLFEEQLKDFDVRLLTDETILEANPAIDPVRLSQLPGKISQQIVKSEFWRIGFAQVYMCLDSDCIFIRPFRASEFMASDGTPYTIIDEGRDIMFPALAKRKFEILENFKEESEQVQHDFGRVGKIYNFGPNCPVWDQRVWKSLEDNYLKPTKQSFMDVILRVPVEMRWYGEALLKYRAIELLPSQPFFKMYHYAWQLARDKREGIKVEQLERMYCGVVYQSAWEREMDWPSEGGNLPSRLARRLRRLLGRT
jgi:hypothetical protein